MKRALPKRRALGRDGKFANTALIPEDAWLEALVNAVVHRSYSVSGDHRAFGSRSLTIESR